MDALLLILATFLPILFAAVILNRIDRAARIRRQPVNVYLVDLFSLIFLIQIPMAIKLQLKIEDEPATMFAVIVFSLMMLLIWWTTIRAVSKAGIVRVSSRVWISILVIPMTYVGSFAIVALGWSLIANPDPVDFWILSMVELLLVCLLVASMWISDRCLKDWKQVDLDANSFTADSPFDD